MRDAVIRTGGLIVGGPEGAGREKGAAEVMFEEIMAENSPNLVKLRNQFIYNRSKRNKTLRNKFKFVFQRTPLRK